MAVKTWVPSPGKPPEPAKVIDKDERNLEWIEGGEDEKQQWLRDQW